MRKIVDRLNRGFTLIELMTTLLIMGILLGIAIPTYREYQIRARMVDVVNTLENLLDQAKQQYANSTTIPSAVSGISAGSMTAYTGSKCVAYVYYDNGAAWNNVGLGAMVKGIVSSECGLGIPGYVAGTSGTKNTVTVAFLASGELLQQYCGSWVDDGTQVPLTYLPSGCQNDAFSTTVTG